MKYVTAEWNKDKVKMFLFNNVIYIVLLILLVVIVAVDGSFLSLENFRFILIQSSTKIILALGVGGILVLGGTDLSAGRMIGLSAVISASLLQSLNHANRIFVDMAELPVFLPILLVAVICAIISGISGVIVSKFNVPPFIVTLGMMLIVYGVTTIYYERIGASPIGGLDEHFKAFAQGSFQIGAVKIPFIVLYAIVISVLVWFIWNKTKLGRNMFAIGGNASTAEVSGINIAKNIICIYVLAGLLYGFSGSLEAARTGSATNNLGNGYEMDAIASCVVGGVSLIGGVGKISGIIAGVLIFQVINYGLVYVGTNPYLLYIIKGVLIITAVAIDTRKHIRKK